MSIYSVLFMVIMNLDISNSNFKTIVHDSVWDIPFVYTMGGQFRWATDDSKGLEKTSIFNNFEHLGLNWNDTKVFQNPNHKQFDKVETLTNKYLKDPIANHAIYPLMLIDPMVYDRHEEYGDLKGGDLKDAGDILISGTDKNKTIALYDYLKWLKCNYQLDIDTKRKEKDFVSNLTEKQLCSGKPLQSYLPIETKKQGFNGWLLLLVLIGLGGCQASGVNKSPKTSFRLALQSKSSNNLYEVYKVTPTLKEIFNITDTELFKYYGGYSDFNTLYDTIVIEYASIPAYKGHYSGEQSYINRQAQSLPPSAWRTYTVNLKPVQDELNRRYHADPDPKWTYRFGIKATITLYIDSNGNITQKVEYSSVTGRVFT